MEAKKRLALSDEEYLRILGENIAQARKKKGLSQLDLCVESGLARSYLAEVELGKRNPTVVSLRKLLKPLRVDLRSILPR